MSAHASVLSLRYERLLPQDVRALMNKAKLKGMFGKVFLIGPETARYILDNLNTHNRRISKPKIVEYTEKMRGGKWLIHSDGISFGETRLNNGQHRLHGVIAADMEVPIFVSFGEDDEAFKVKDTGKPRTKADLFHIIFGDKNAATVAGMSRVLVTLSRHEAGLESDARGKKTYDDQVLLDKREELSEDVALMISAVTAGSKIGRRFSISTPGSAAAYLWIMQHTRLKHRVAEFFDALDTGANLSKDDPRYVLRRQFEQHQTRVAKKSVSTIYSNCKHSQPVETAALLVLAWNAFAASHTRKNLFDWQVGEAFPKVSR